METTWGKKKGGGISSHPSLAGYLLNPLKVLHESHPAAGTAPFPFLWILFVWPVLLQLQLAPALGLDAPSVHPVMAETHW